MKGRGEKEINRFYCLLVSLSPCPLVSYWLWLATVTANKSSYLSVDTIVKAIVSRVEDGFKFGHGEII